MTGSLGSSATPNRVLQLIAGIICMVMVANYQYGWTYFVAPMDAKNQWGGEGLPWAFTLFVFTEPWLGPVEGWLVDRFGPRSVVIFGGILVAIGWSINSFAESL